MKRLKINKDREVRIKIELSIHCDFCGEQNKKVFTSEFDECENTHKCNMQICEDCVIQLWRFIK